MLDKLLTKLLNKTEDEIKALIYDGDKLKDDAFEIIYPIIENGQTKKQKTMFDNGVKKGQSESLTKLENDVKIKYQVQSEKQGIELFDEIISKKGNSQLDENAVKSNPLYLALESKIANEYVPKTEHEKVTNEFTEYKTKSEKASQFASIKMEALKQFDANKFLVSSDPVRAANQREDFVNKLNAFDFEKIGDNYYLMQDGKRLEDNNGSPITLSKHVKDEGLKYFDIDIGGNGGGSEGGSKSYSFKSEDDYNVALDKAKTSEERFAIQDAYYASIGKAPVQI